MSERRERPTFGLEAHKREEEEEGTCKVLLAS
jgi:hypothetical protein